MHYCAIVTSSVEHILLRNHDFISRAHSIAQSWRHQSTTTFRVIMTSSSRYTFVFRWHIVSFNVCVALAFRYAFASLRVCAAFVFRWRFVSFSVCVSLAFRSWNVRYVFDTRLFRVRLSSVFRSCNVRYAFDTRLFHLRFASMLGLCNVCYTFILKPFHVYYVTVQLVSCSYNVRPPYAVSDQRWSCLRKTCTRYSDVVR